MAGPYVVTPLVDVVRGEGASLPPGATVVLVTAVMTQGLAQEAAEIRARGYQVQILYAGDGGPSVDVPGIRMVRAGRALEALGENEPVLAN